MVGGVRRTFGYIGRDGGKEHAGDVDISKGERGFIPVMMVVVRDEMGIVEDGIGMVVVKADTTGVGVGDVRDLRIVEFERKLVLMALGMMMDEIRLEDVDNDVEMTETGDHHLLMILH